MRQIRKIKICFAAVCTAVIIMPLASVAHGSKDKGPTGEQGNNSDMMPPGAFDPNQQNNGPGTGGPGAMNQKQAELTAVFIIDGKKIKTTAFPPGIMQSIGENQNVLLAENTTSVTIKDVTFYKNGDSLDPNQSNFSGMNAVICSASGSTIDLKNTKIYSDSEGSNALFATGDNSVITAANVTIHTKGNSSRGLDATYNGTVKASNVNITTEGAHCAALATDRGEGTVIVTDGTVKTSGEGSPNIYSTGSITAVNLTGTATGSEIAAIEGKNSITIENCSLSGASTHGIMLYQSMSGDANEGTAVFTAKKSMLTSSTDGPFFYITNTSAKVFLSETTLSWKSNQLIHVSGNTSERGWGTKGSNGGMFVFTAENENIAGDVYCDEISSAELKLQKDTIFSGAVDKERLGKVSITLAKDAVWKVTGNSYIDVLSDDDASFANIKSGGYTIFYDKNDKDNNILKGKSYTLSDGGKIVPYKADRSKLEAALKQQAAGKKQGMPPKNGSMGNPPDMNGGQGNPPDMSSMPKPPDGNGGAPNGNPAPNMNPQGGKGMPGGQQSVKSVVPKNAVIISGKIKIVGNEPKTAVIFEAENGKQYSMQLYIPDLKLYAASSLQGENLECIGIIRDYDSSVMPGIDNAKDGIFVLYSYHTLN